MAVKKTALFVDHELVDQVKALLGTTTTSETIAEAMREVLRVQGRGNQCKRGGKDQFVHFDVLLMRILQVVTEFALG